MNNQDIKADAGKPQLTLVPTEIINDIAYIRMYGVKKYGKKESWKDVEIERYRDAMFRHMIAYLNDPQGNDEESGLPHLWHLACNVAFLCELEKNKKDRLDSTYEQVVKYLHGEDIKIPDVVNNEKYITKENK